MKEGLFSIRFEDRKTYLYVHVSGEDSYETCLDALIQAAEKAQDLGIPKVLIHKQLSGEISEGELFSILQKVVPMSIGLQVAFFDENRSHAEFNQLGELMAQNRGINIQMCSSLEEAECWLSERSSARLGHKYGS